MLAHYAGNRRSFKAVDRDRISHSDGRTSHWRLTIRKESQASRTTDSETKLHVVTNRDLPQPHQALLSWLSQLSRQLWANRLRWARRIRILRKGRFHPSLFHPLTDWLKQRRFGKAHYFQSDFGCLANWIVLFVIGIRLEWYGITILGEAQMLTTCIGNSTFAAITAIVAANLVLVAYIITAVLEDRTSATSEGQTVEKETKKDRWIVWKPIVAYDKIRFNSIECTSYKRTYISPAISLSKYIVGSISIAKRQYLHE